MTRYLLDTSVLVRLANAADTSHLIAKLAVARLAARGDVAFVSPQCLTEFRAVATRPVGPTNGLGLSSVKADTLVDEFEQDHPLLPDTPAIYPMWKWIVSALAVEGKTVHDARLVAVCHVHAVTHVLTFNTRHFTRLATHPPGLVVVHPSQV